MDSRLILVVIGVIAMALGRSEAVTCYYCTSLIDSKCAYPFNPNGIQTCQGVTCGKVRATTSGVTIFGRGCSMDAIESDGCHDNTVAGETSTGCVCRTDYCNGGQVGNSG